MFRFEHHIFFYAFLAVPVMVLVFAWYLYNSRQRIKKLGEIELVRSLIPDVSLSKKITKLILFLFGISSLILALCNLQTGNKMDEVKREGADIIVCLDVSNSMMAQDLSPNRLERAKFALEKMIDKLQGDRLGIVVFAGEAYVQLPITTDYSAAKLFLGSINTQMVPTQGTNIGAAIRKAMDGFSKDEGKNKTIVVITDGENHEPEAIEAAEDAEKAGIMINTIGIGSESGVPIPLINNGVVSGYRKDKEGNTIVTKLNKSLLQEIAGKANGIYVQATNADIGLDAILSKLNELDKKQLETKMYTDYEDQFQWFLGLALIFLFFEFLISERVSNWFRNFFRQVLKTNKAGLIVLGVMISATASLAQNEKQLLYNGNRYYKEGRSEMAINQYREALKTKQDYRKANFNLGDAIYKEAMSIKDSKSNKPIMGMKPDSLANIMLDEAAGQFDVVSQTVSDKDTLHRAYHNLGNCRLMQKKYDEAINAYKKALKLDPKDEDTRYNLAYALTKKKEEDKKNNKNQQQQQQQQEKQQQQQQQPQMSKQEAERMLNALKNTEQKLQGKKKKGEGERVKVEKDW